jgi:hypothetical protein
MLHFLLSITFISAVLGMKISGLGGMQGNRRRKKKSNFANFIVKDRLIMLFPLQLDQVSFIIDSCIMAYVRYIMMTQHSCIFSWSKSNVNSGNYEPECCSSTAAWSSFI